MPNKKRKAKRRLLDIEVDEISVVDNPAIDEVFVLVKREEASSEVESSMNLKIKAALEAKGMTLEQLAEAAKIDLERLKAVMDGSADLTEEELGRIASALGLEKLDDEEDDKSKKAEDGIGDADAETKPDEEPAEVAEGGVATSMHKQLFDERLQIIADAAMDLKISGDMDIEEVRKRLCSISNVIWSMHDTAEVAMLTKKADVEIDAAEDRPGIAKAMGHLVEAMGVVKKALNEEDDDKAEQSEDSLENDDVIVVPEHPGYVALKKENEELTKKVAGLEKSGISKSLSEDDSSQNLSKKDEGCQWGFLADDFKD